MHTRFIKPTVGATVILCLATGCGIHASLPAISHSRHARTHAPMVSTLVKTATTKTTVLHPTSFMNITQGTTATTQQVTVPLKNSAKDTLTLSTNPAARTGSLTVTNPSGHILLTLPQVGGLSILQFGSTHPPVVITQAAGNLCGSGGCNYTAYTWSNRRRTFVTVPAPTIPSFQYRPATNQFAQVAGSAVSGLFGFLTADANGVNLDERLYDLWNHDEVLPYAYATNGSPGGQWVFNGAPEYTPRGPLPTTMMTTPAMAIQALLEARSLNLKTQGYLLLPGGSVDQSVWQTLSGLATWGPNLWVDSNNPRVSAGANGTDKVSEVISGMHGDRPQSVLEAFRLTAHTVPNAGTYAITTAHLSPISLKVDSTLAVLSDLRSNPQDRKYLRQHPGPLSVTAYGLTWQVSIGSGTRVHSWLQINAETGAVTPSSSSAG